MSKDESSPMIIKSEPRNDDLHYINDKINFHDEPKTEVDLECIKEDMKEEPLIEVKQEEIIIKEDFEQSPTSFTTETSTTACTAYIYKTSRTHNLKQHIVDANATGEKSASYANFRCAECKYETPIKGNLKSHMKKHTGETQFACKLCDFKTAHKHNLKCHMKKHTGEKPFACNLCDSKFTSKQNLKLHIKTHAVEKPFACNLYEFKEDIKEYESLIKVKQEEITIKNEIPSSSNCHQHPLT